jgi:hypothetical protein
VSKVKTFNIPFLPNLYRGLGTVLVLTLAGLSIAHAAANCSSLFSQVNVATTYGVPLVKGRIAPLQSHAGMAEVKTKFEDFNDEAKLVASIKGQPARDAAWSIIVRESNTTVEGYIDPEGVLRPADAHHKLLAILKLMEDYGFPRESVEWKLKVPVENDFSGRSWEEFGKHIEDRGIRYLSSDEEDLSRQLGETPGQRIRRIPTEFDLMKNSPMRSVTGRFFSLIGVKGTTLKPMAQFETERDLMHDLAVSPKAGGEYDTKLQGRILFLFFRSAQSETLTQNLIGRAHPELRGLVSDSLKKVAHYLIVSMISLQTRLTQFQNSVKFLVFRKTILLKRKRPLC